MTHLLTGAVLARTGFHRQTAYATVAMAIAAEFPDCDTIWSLGGPVTGFMHHRGITHTFVGVPVEAALITAGALLYARWRGRLESDAHGKPGASATWLYAGTLLALLSHLLLDWTNNYGIRPFFPFNPRWYAGSFVFIVEPVLLLLLAAALVLPALFGLINAEVGSREARFVSAGWSYVALVGIASLYLLRIYERDAAIRLVGDQAPDAARIFASPHPINPFAWSVVSDFGDRYQLSAVDTRRQVVAPPEPADTLFKPAPNLPIETARRSRLGQIYLDWSIFPVLTESPDTSDPRHPLTRVTFSDARFMYDTTLSQGRNAPPLSAWVLLDPTAPAGQQAVETRMNNKLQR